VNVTVTPLVNSPRLVDNAAAGPTYVEISPEPVVTPDAVRAQLDRLLAADAFASAGRLSRLLRYLVERTLSGDGARLKEYALGVDVFDRGDAYDPRLDSIVRVEVRRLRARLDEYYRGPGAADPIVIAIPRGAYAPVFTAVASVASETAGPSPPAPLLQADRSGHSPRALRSFGAAGIAAVVLAAVFLASMLSWRPAAPTAQASPGPSIAVLPFEHYSTDPADAMAAARLTDAVTTELARLGTLSVVSRTTASRFADGRHDARETAPMLGVDFIVESTVTIDGGRIGVVARLVSGEIDRKVWVGEYDVPASEMAELSRRVAAEAAARALTYRATR
jgi:adenylate cyclase